MKKRILIVFSILLISAVVSLAFIYQQTGPHGGTVKEAGYYAIEMKNMPDNLYTWLLDKKLKPHPNKDITCEVRFFYPDNTTIETFPKPFEEDGFTVKVTPGFHSCRIVYHVAGKEVSAKFENDFIIVQKKTE